MAGFLDAGQGAAPIDAKTGRERLSGQESSVFQQNAAGPRVAGPQGGGGDQPGDKSLDQVNADAARVKGVERQRKLDAMKEPTQARRIGKNAWDRHGPLGEPAPVAAPTESAGVLTAGKKNLWDKHAPLHAAG